MKIFTLTVFLILAGYVVAHADPYRTLMPPVPVCPMGTVPYWTGYQWLCQ